MLEILRTTHNRKLPAQPDAGYDTLREAFTDPSSDYRGKPFWAWNSAINEAEALSQIAMMKRMGMGGFFIHARTGLKTPYLSDAWFDLIKACCRKAKQLAMQVWLYDEDRWPSGFSGGLVTQDVRFRQRRLRMEVFFPSQFVWKDDDLAVFSAELSGHQAASLKRLAGPGDVSCAAGNRILAFSMRIAEPSDAYNGQTYVDTLSEAAVARFIEVTHEAYRRHVGDYFGRVIKGIFTDEPNHGPTCVHVPDSPGECPAFEIPWTETLPEAFRTRYGYDILDYLPEVFFDTGSDGVQQVRHHYHDCKTGLFVNAFSRQIARWCQTNGLQMTGHVLHESPLHAQVSSVGSAMRFYEHMHIPGVDILTDCHFQTDGHPEYDTPKQCVSVQRQMGRRQMLSEMYGCTGWDFPLDGHKRSGDWQAALGVNMRCHHLLWYSMEGQAKRDYPASIFYQSPWWEDYKHVEDYFSRVNVIMTRGRAVCKLLVLHPNETLWQTAKVDWIRHENKGIDKWVPGPAVRTLEQRYLRIRDALIAANIDFDYGDEEMLSRLGGLDDTVPEITLGKSSYAAVLVPPLKTIRKSTLDLLKRFAHRGGTVFVVDQMPGYVDAVKSPHARHFQKICYTLPADGEGLVEAVGKLRSAEVVDAEGRPVTDVLIHSRQDGRYRYLFVCSTRSDRAYDGLTLKVHKADALTGAEQWDPHTGRICAYPVQHNKGTLQLAFDLPPSGSALFVLTPHQRRSDVLHERLTPVDRTALDGPYAYTLSEDNVLVLDRASFKLPEASPSTPLDVLKIDNVIRERLGLTPRQGKMVQPWLARDATVAPYPVELIYTLTVETLPDGPLRLALEKPDSVLKAYLNDTAIDLKADCGWWIDKALRCVTLKASDLRRSRNTLRLTVDYARCMGLESLYLLGRFGVRVSGAEAVLTPLPSQLTAADWCAQGLPFYSGAVAYHLTFTHVADKGRRIFLAVPRFGGSCLRVSVNDRPARTLWRPPYETEITDAVKPGANTAVVEVISHRRNTLGPLHLPRNGRRLPWTGPREYITDPPHWQDDYDLSPCGLWESPQIIYNKD